MTTTFKSSRPRRSLRRNAVSRIVQQLLIPPDTIKNDDGSVFINPYGNILMDIESKEALKAVAETFNPAYMGAAEFEWGALPKSLSRMFEDNTIVHRELPLAALENTVAPRNVHYVGSSEVADQNMAMMYKVYEKGYMNRFEEHPKYVSKNDCGSLYVQVKAKYDGTDKYIATRYPKYDERLMGWYDLEHDFAVFTDEYHSELFYNLEKGNDK